jgi:two-component system phosphate regulon sensor histidine kinase PhoR
MVQADDKQIIVNIKLSTEPIFLNGNIEDLKEVVINLFVNAIRYTEEKGTINISTEICGDMCEFRVEDSGIGISEEDLPNIFEEFFRSENAKKEIKYGTGLGLSLVKQIVDNYQGLIDVRSELEKGTCFSVKLPRQEEPVKKK